MLILDIFLLRPSAPHHAFTNPRSPYWVAVILVLTALLYGFLFTFFQLQLDIEIGGLPAGEFPTAILVGGNLASAFVITIAVHVGLTIIVWMMARAAGGPGFFVGLYRAVAYLLPLGWFALPAITLYSVSKGCPTPPLPFDWAYHPLAVAGAALFLAGLYQTYLTTQQRGPLRAAISTVLAAVFCVSILLITIGSPTC